MRLNRLSVDHPKSRAIKAHIARLAAEGRLDTQIRAERIERVELISLDADVKESTWAVAISIAYISVDKTLVEEKIFVKLPDQKTFENERKSVELLCSLGVQLNSKVHIPTQFIASGGLIVAPFIDGQNAKWVLRKCLVNPWSTELKQQLAAQFYSYGKWLAQFHKTGVSNTPTPGKSKFSKGLEELLYVSRAAVLSAKKNESVLAMIREQFEATIDQHVLECVHGDFGPQNVIVTADSFAVIDWEMFHRGHGVEDCTHFVINTLTQVRHAPYDFGYIRKAIDHFLQGYTADNALISCYADLVPLLAISNIYKRQEWTGREFSIFERAFFVPFLRKLAIHYYRNWKGTASPARS